MPDLVTVACKIPNGLLLQHNHQKQKVRIAMPGGMFIEEMLAVRTGPQVKINGNRAPYGQAPEWPIVFGFGLTQVDAVWWEEWWAHNQEFPPVQAKLLFAWDKPEDTRAEAREHKDTLSGLEPLSPATKMVNGREVHTDPRWPRRTNPQLTEVGEATRDE